MEFNGIKNVYLSLDAGATSLLLVGGTDPAVDVARFKENGAHVLVGTPGADTEGVSTLLLASILLMMLSLFNREAGRRDQAVWGFDYGFQEARGQMMALLGNKLDAPRGC